MNLHDDVVLPIKDEYDRLYNLCGHDVDYDDDTYEDMHEDAIALDDDIELKNVRRGIMTNWRMLGGGMMTKLMLHYLKCHW